MNRKLIGLLAGGVLLLPLPAAWSQSSTPQPIPVGTTQGECEEIGHWNPGPSSTTYSGGRFIVDSYAHTFDLVDPCPDQAHQSLFFAIQGDGIPYFELVLLTMPDGVCFSAYGQNNGYSGCETAKLSASGQYQMRGLHVGSNVWEFSYRWRLSSTATWGAWTLVDRWNTGVASVKRMFVESSAYVNADMSLPERTSVFTGIGVRRASDSVWLTPNIVCPHEAVGTFDIVLDNDPKYRFDKEFATQAGRARVVQGTANC